MPLPSLKAKRKYELIPSAGIGLIVIFFGFSAALHLLSLVSMPSFSEKSKENEILRSKRASKLQPIHVQVRRVKKLAEPSEAAKKLVEAKQEATPEAPLPEKARYSYTTHKARKETKLAKPRELQKALDPGKIAGAEKAQLSSAQRRAKDEVAAKLEAGSNTQQSKPADSSQDSPPQASLSKPHLLSMEGGLAIAAGEAVRPKSSASLQQVERNSYEKLLNHSLASLDQEVRGGYQDYLDEDLELGNAVDLNTQEYRYISYFTNLRKAIELAWVYPGRALKSGLSGNVFLRFTINGKGDVSRIVVLDSSGHHILDHAVVDAIKLASPFAPLPESFGKKLHIKGTFRYILN